MQRSKLSWHMQSVCTRAVDDVRFAMPEYVKVMDPPEQNPFPEGVKPIVRFYMPDEEFNALVREGPAGAQKWYRRWLPEMQKRPWAWAFECGNEPQPMWDAGFVDKLVEFTIAISVLMRRHGLTMAGLNLSVGWPFLARFGDPAPRAARLRPAVESLADNGHILGLHEYSAPAMWDSEGAHCLRYRHTMEEWGVDIPLFITECGIDGGVAPVHRPRTGWKTYCHDDEGSTAVEKYLAQLQWYDRRLQEDAYVKAGFIFNICGNQDWHDFELEAGMSHALAQYIRASEEPETPDPEPLPDVQQALVAASNRIKQAKELLNADL